MTDDREWGSDMEDMEPGDVPEPGPDEPELVPESPAPGSAPADEGRSFGQAAKETVAKAVGMAVELGSVLGGQGGEIVSAERDVAEAETEDLIERVDGEGE